MNKFIIKIGDPSHDGHNISIDILIECNYDKDELLEAYHKSCDKMGLYFHGNSECPLRWDHPEYNDRHIAVDYQDIYISRLAENILKSHGIDIREDWDYMRESPQEELYIDSPKVLITIIMLFIKASLPDLKYKIIKDNTPVFELTFGYGLFD